MPGPLTAKDWDAGTPAGDTRSTPNEVSLDLGQKDWDAGTPVTPPRTLLSKASALVKGAASNFDPTVLAQAILHLPSTVAGAGEAQLNLLKRAYGIARGTVAPERNNPIDRYGEAATDAILGLVPILGPTAVDIGDEARTGDPYHAIGRGIGAVATMVPGAFDSVAGLASKMPGASALADRIAKYVPERVAKTLGPHVGAGMDKFRNQMEKAAPAVLDDPTLAASTRAGVHANVRAELTKTGNAFDAAIAQRIGRPGESAVTPTAPLLGDLEAARQKLISHPIVGPTVTQNVPAAGGLLGPNGQPFMKSVTKPVGVAVENNPVKLGVINDAIRRVKALGPRASYEALQKIRQDFDTQWRQLRGQPVSADAAADFSRAEGAKEAANAIRTHLAKADPQTAAINRRYSLLTTVDDVLEAARQADRDHPRLARQIATRVGAMAAGAGADGAPGALIAAAMSPLLEHGVAALTEGTSLKLSRALRRIQVALKTGNANGLLAGLGTIKVLGKQLPGGQAAKGLALQGARLGAPKAETGDPPTSTPESLVGASDEAVKAIIDRAIDQGLEKQ